MTEEKRELLYCWVTKTLSVLVPKKRGAGFLRTPYGHHHIPALTSIAEAVRSDVIGLDGALEFECGGKVYYGGDGVRAEYIGLVIPALEKHYGVTAREVTEPEFWRHHPLTNE